MKFVVSLLLSTLCAGTAAAQTPNAPTPVPMPTQTMPAEPNEEMPSYDNPYDAYDAGAFEQALHGFIDKQVSDPENPELMLHVGSANYGLANYADAEKSFHQAYLRGDEKVRAQAAYNLGNCTFRQGKLEDAVEHYKKALELNEDDQDAKFNLEFTRDEIRRHVEEAKKQAEERQNQEQQQEPNENQDPQQQNPQEEGQEQGEQSQEAGNQEPTEQTDTDQDGLSDTLERSGENPTDPQNPDTDNDGLKDGQEDMNRNGKVDEGESDPNKADTNGDGIPDGQAQEAQPAEQNTEKKLTPEEAQRYLQGLQEGKPKRKRTKGGRRNSGKDW
jgi:tetratricopeptide (TPR) repeat protein